MYSICRKCKESGTGDRLATKVSTLARAGLPTELLPELARPPTPQKKQTVALGKFKVNKELLNTYVELYITNSTSDPSYITLVLSTKIMNIHKALRESVGLTGFWSADREDEFDKALSALAIRNLRKDERYKERLQMFRAKERSKELKTDAR